MGLFNRNDAEEFKQLQNFESFLSSLLDRDEYISKKEYLSQVESIADTVHELQLMEERKVLVNWCNNNSVNYKRLKSLLEKYETCEASVNSHNSYYINKHLQSDKEYLDTLLRDDDPNILLDEEQRKVVLSDEDYTLVVAGAGAGKTTTIEAKVKFLTDRKGISPDRILIVSFTRKATLELKERFKRLDIPVHIATFHSIGNSIVRQNDPERYKIVEAGFMYRTIEDYLTSKLDDDYFIKKILLFFASYLNMPFEAEDAMLMFKSLAENEITTIRSDLSKILDEYHREQTKAKISINDEHVRSMDECRIANFLFIKGIEYEYEPVYPYTFENTIKPYCPDFKINYNGQEIYLEHFGISEEGRNNRFTKEELEQYKKHVNDKILLHRKHGTKLIYTFSSYKDGRDMIAHLDELLKQNDIKYTTLSSMDIYRRLIEKAQDKYFNKLILLVCNFINRFKVNNYDIATKFDEWQFSIKNERTKLFLEIAKQCFHYYEARKTNEHAIDFEDMINDASNVLDARIANNDPLPYDYIFVDEYQDISLQRFDLCQKLSKASNAKIIAVGDDWQSIFRFSGAQIDLFTKFEERMGYAKILKITKTYRNSQELIDIAGKFVMENQKQIKKDLRSNKSIKDPVILMSYNDSYDKDEFQHGPFYRLGEAIAQSLDDIVARCGVDKDVLLIGRYGFDGKNLANLEDFFSFEGKRLQYKKYPELKIEFMTAHSSKGLGRDNVIIINGKDDILGFPSKIEDDPVMKLVIKEDESIDFEEERRLFYVALTRTKNRVYIVAPQHHPSKFILEIKEKFTTVILRGVELNPVDGTNYKFKCPVCGYPLQKRQSKLKITPTIKKLWICSNDPEVCGFMTNDLKGNTHKFSISKCPQCYDGYLIVKPIKNQSGGRDTILGCTNYKEDGTGCSCIMHPGSFTQDKSAIIINKKGKVINAEIKPLINKMLSCGMQLQKKYPKFYFGYKSFMAFLSGDAENNVIKIFKLSGEEGFGMMKDKTPRYIYLLIKVLVDMGIIAEFKDDKGYKCYDIKTDHVTDDEIVTIKSAFPL